LLDVRFQRYVPKAIKSFTTLYKREKKDKSNLDSTNDNNIYTTIEQEEENLLVIEKSKFLTKVFPAKTIEDALNILDDVKDIKATHNCWAFRGIDYNRFNDDGEPSGTAGRPILNAIESENMFNVFIVVIRYFGGIKLGTGGLQRAYFDAAKEVLKKTKKVLVIRKTTIVINIPIVNLGIIHQFTVYLNTILKNQNIDANDNVVIRGSEVYSDDGCDALITLHIPNSIVDVALQNFLDISNGIGTITIVESNTN
jgi:uncharacterized YigZ family protein